MKIRPTSTFPDLINQLNQAFARRDQALIFADTDALPDSAPYKGKTALLEDDGTSTPRLIYSDGANWRRADTNATL